MKRIIKIFICIFVINCFFNNVFSGTLAKQYKEYKNAYISLGISTFSDEEKQLLSPFEIYSPLDSLGRCGVAFANICREIMPTDERGSIGMIKPSGWQTPQSKYDFIEGKFLYNRCHLIAFELAGENANEQNLVTGTRYMNINGMLPFENQVANHVKSTNHHVLYRSTPIFEGNNLLCEGVQIEAYCVEEHGGSIDFNVFCYNVQPGVDIDYTTGKNWLSNFKIEP